jgi:hypothetical protein
MFEASATVALLCRYGALRCRVQYEYADDRGDVFCFYADGALSPACLMSCPRRLPIQDGRDGRAESQTHSPSGNVFDMSTKPGMPCFLSAFFDGILPFVLDAEGENRIFTRVLLGPWIAGNSFVWGFVCLV